MENISANGQAVIAIIVFLLACIGIANMGRGGGKK